MGVIHPPPSVIRFVKVGIHQGGLERLDLQVLQAQGEARQTWGEAGVGVATCHKEGQVVTGSYF